MLLENGSEPQGVALYNSIQPLVVLFAGNSALFTACVSGGSLSCVENLVQAGARCVGRSG